MKYKNAKDVLPKELLREVKKYAAGSLLYIPSEEAEHLDSQMKRSLTDFKQNLMVRNQRIYNEYLAGKSITELADEYYLSLDTVKKMVYGKNKYWIPFDFSVQTAAKYSSNGLAEEWVRTYLIRKTGNADSYNGNCKVDGLLRFPIRLIDETAEPSYATGDNEPVLITFSNHKFTFIGKKDFLTELIGQKQFSVPAFVILEDEKEYPFYYENYGKPFSNGRMYAK